MSNETIGKISFLFSFFLSLFSSLLALKAGGDLFFVIIERFFVVFAISVFLIWTTLKIINSVIINAAKESVSTILEGISNGQTMTDQGGGLSMAEKFKKAHEEATSKGQNLDLTSAPQEDVLGIDTLPENENVPEIKEFEPFKPRKIETDNDNSTQ